jgi:glycosyltransferase involved in cell wall biosynthesis
MRLLFVTPRLPALPCHEAARLAAAQLIDRLAGRHTIAVVAATGGGDTPAQHAWLAERAAFVETAPLGRWRHAWTGRPGDGLAALGALARRAAARFVPDVIHLEGALLAPLARATDAPSVLACHDCATLRARDMRRAGASTWRRLVARVAERVETTWARTWFGAARACVVDSEDERRALAEHVPSERIDVVPTGIDDVTYAYRRRGDPWRLVFTGDWSSPRDVAAARRLALAILPRVRHEIPRLELLLAGSNLAGDAMRALGALPGVRITGALTDVRASLWGAAVYVSPLHAGFSRKARLLEPMALGTPVVASAPTLVAMPDAVPGQHVLAADGDEEFARSIALLLRAPRLANTVARNARDLVERRYTWRAVAARYEALYARLAPMRAAEAAA